MAAWHLKMWLIGCPETSVSNYKYMLRDNPERRNPNPSVTTFWLRLPGTEIVKFKCKLYYLILI